MQRPKVRLAPALLLLGACSSGAPVTGDTDATTTDATPGPGSFPGTEGPPTTTGTTAATTTTGATADPTTGPDLTTGDPTGGGEQLCPTALRFDPPPGAADPRVAGEWHGFELASATWIDGPDHEGM